MTCIGLAHYFSTLVNTYMQVVGETVSLEVCQSSHRWELLPPWKDALISAQLKVILVWKRFSNPFSRASLNIFNKN